MSMAWGEHAFGNWHIENLSVVLNSGTKMFYFLRDGFTFVVFFCLLICLCATHSICLCVYWIFHRKKCFWKGHPGLVAPPYSPEYIALYAQRSDPCDWLPSAVGSCLRHQESQCWNHA